jgi:hypothetical protein
VINERTSIIPKKEEWKHKRHKKKKQKQKQNKTPDWKSGEGAMLGKQ